MNRRELMVEAVQRRVGSGRYTDFEVIDYAELEPGVTILTFRYTHTFRGRASTHTSWLLWCNGHEHNSGTLWTDFSDALA